MKDTPKYPTRPDLGARPATADGGNRILASLEQGGAPGSPYRSAAQTDRSSHLRLNRFATALAALTAMLALGVIAMLLWHRTDDAEASKAYADVARQHASATAPVPASAPVVASAPDNAAAVILDARPVPTAATPVKVAAKAAAEAPASAAAERTRRAAVPPHAAPAPSSPPPRLAARTQRAAAPPGKTPMKRTASVPLDSDVALLAALVSHANSPAVFDEAPTDGASQRDGDNMAERLRRCQRVRDDAALQCRARACAGRWEHEAACRTAGGN